MTRTEVKSENDLLILVDADDKQVGSLDKEACHDGDGVLHRAFSLFLFDERGRLLLQRRSKEKRLWPKYWSNSCCSHPRYGEAMEVATARRLREELNTAADVEFIYKFAYQARFSDRGSENELCWVYLGRLGQALSANEAEIEELRFISANELNREIDAVPERFTPWFKMEWKRLNEEFADQLGRYTSPL